MHTVSTNSILDGFGTGGGAPVRKMAIRHKLDFGEFVTMRSSNLNSDLLFQFRNSHIHDFLIVFMQDSSIFLVMVNFQTIVLDRYVYVN